MPALAALGTYGISVLTLGVGLVLAPVGVVLSILAVRRTEPPRSVLLWVGGLANTMMTLVVVYILVAGAA